MTTDTDTAAALEAAIDAIACRRCDHDDPIGSTDRSALHRAIAAHVEAEVARRLAAAPDVEVAIVDYALAAQGDFDTSEERDALRAAIAADKARAVDEATRRDAERRPCAGWVEEPRRWALPIRVRLLPWPVVYREAGSDWWAWHVGTEHGRADDMRAAQLAAEDALNRIAAEIIAALERR